MKIREKGRHKKTEKPETNVQGWSSSCSCCENESGCVELKLRKLSQEATTRVELKTMALRLVAVTVGVVGRVFVEEWVVSVGEGKRFIWRENIVMVGFVATIQHFLFQILIAYGEDERTIPFLSYCSILTVNIRFL